MFAVCMAALNGVAIAGLVLSGDISPDPNVMKLCERAFETGLPLLSVQADSYVAATMAASIDKQVPVTDVGRIQMVMQAIAEKIHMTVISKRITIPHHPRLSPAAFQHSLVERSRALRRRILLPEGEDIRVIKAAVISHDKELATCVLLGNPVEIHRLADAHGKRMVRMVYNGLNVGLAILIVYPFLFRIDCRYQDSRKFKGD